MSSQESITESEGRYLDDGYWKYGRFYGSWQPGKYLFPVDSEELDRMDLFHKVFLVARGNKLFHAPVTRPKPRIMDLGTGTGIWAINVAEDWFPDAQIMAVDLNKIQPALIPVGVIPKQYDIEEPMWTPLLADCDLIHIRMLLGSIQTDLWPQLYRKVFEHLTPGLGHIEHIEIDWTPRWDGDEKKPANSPFQQWAQLFLAGMDQFNRSARVTPRETRQMIEAAGFTDVRQDVIQALVCPWSPDWRKREIARWFNLALSLSLESLSMMPLIEKQGLKYEEVRELCARVKREICNSRYHTYCNIYVWTAAKPE
ncbi:methyl transferase [Dactylonectria macrodidyma]|uniref:Methyl transferase n=1 Tax=Dactylonectria macrodidyma TaxID=307937 RepID=A0A9P9FSN2_9HYPO|nr:methyl transferase [Dactylonectria macrodidyma]